VLLKNRLYLKPGMEQMETERKKIGLKHGNRIFEHGTIKKRYKIFFNLFSAKMRKRNN
jgi:hypothetical protein